MDLKEARRNYQKKLKELKKTNKIKSANKYSAERTGNKASKLENSVEGMIRLHEKAGEWKLLGSQYAHTFYVNGVKIIKYIPDYHLLDLKSQNEFWIEAKGDQTTYDWMVKRNLWHAIGPGKLLVYSGNHSNPVLVQTIMPVFVEKP